jgi:ABC-type transport system involved in cytochrome bd biosynthesis fused ATPase/permease subunit
MVCTQSIRFGIPSLEVVHQLLVAAPRMTQAPPAVETLGEVCIEVDELTSPSGVTLVRDRSLRLVKGDVLLVSGPSGIGKSTLVKALIDGSPGVRISVNGRRLEQGLTQAGIAVGMAGQRALIFPASLADNVLPQDAAAAAGSQRVAEVVSSLADRHKGSILDESIVLQHLEREVTPANLSGGQAQRIALMRAVLCGNDLLLFDEPTSALDTSSRDRFMELIRAIARTRIVVIVSHDLELQAVATQTLTLRAEQ